MFIVWFLVVLPVLSAQDCRKRDYGNGGHVCVCTASYCDIVPKPDAVEAPSYLIYTSNKAGLRFHKSEGTFNTTENISENKIFIQTNQLYQEVLGWGGAFTDSTGINIDSLDEETQENLLKSYFSEDGIEYNLCRVPIGGTDFSTYAYSYNDGEKDPNLLNFNLTDEDFLYKIPYIKKAVNLTKGNLRLFASVWTAPKWMKTNDQYFGGFLREDMYQPWADYFMKFFEKYHEQGIEFWGLTTQNEPSLVLQNAAQINSVGWTFWALSTWIRDNLGPTLKNSNHSEIKIIIGDDQMPTLLWYQLVLLDNSTNQFVDGIAIHWYSDFKILQGLLDSTHHYFPDKFLLATEACNGWLTNDVILGSWERGEAYADNIIEDVRNWVTGWVDWNMALDLNGGPSYINNFVDSPIIVNSTSGEFYKQPMFYAIGHFSKFVPKGSINIGSSSTIDGVITAAFKRPDNQTVVVILNKKNTNVSITLVDDSCGSTRIDLSEKSITTLMYQGGTLASASKSIVPTFTILITFVNSILFRYIL